MTRRCPGMHNAIGSALVTFAAVAFIGAAKAQTCAADNHRVEFLGKNTNFRNYLCKTGDGSLLRVTFYRLGETATGGLLMGEQTYESRKGIGDFELIENDISAEARDLFKRFGAWLITDPTNKIYDYRVEIDVPPVKGAGNTAPARDSLAPPNTQKNWFLEGLGNFSFNHAISINKANEVIENTAEWPAVFNLYYNCSEEMTSAQVLQCTTLWQYAKIEDLTTIENDTLDFEKEASEAITADTGVSDNEQVASESENASNSYARHFPMFRHLAKYGWPEQFLVISGDIPDHLKGFRLS